MINRSCIFDETGINSDPSESRVLRKDGVLVSNSLAAFAYIRGRWVRRGALEGLPATGLLGDNTQLGKGK